MQIVHGLDNIQGPYRTAAGAEIDLLLDIPGHGLQAFDIKLGLAARPTKGFHIACGDLKPVQRYLIHSGTERYAAGEGIEAVGLAGMAAELAKLNEASV